MPTVANLACTPIPLVRIALIGLGGRGMKTLERYAFIHGAEIRYLVDIDEQRVLLANQELTQSGRPQAKVLIGEKAWAEACSMQDIDVVYICTEWRSHTTIATEAMRCGKHVIVEVPAATTLRECWQLVETAEKTRRHLFMAENCCYDFFALQTLEIKRRGLFGQIMHCEGAYIHNLNEYKFAPQHGDTKHNWMIHSCAQHGGNPYPTHAIGPIAQLLDFHNQDRMMRLVSLSSSITIPNECNSELGHINNTLILTERGVSILLQLDVSTNRPYNRLQTVCGTKGFAQKYPLPTLQLEGEKLLTGNEALSTMQKFATSPTSQLWQRGHQLGVPNEMNYAMDARLIYCLQNGLPLDIDVYDAAEWSCLAELTQLSASQGNIPIDIPQFRR
jgi:predicted dehydrogenase